MNHILPALTTLLLSAVLAAPALAQGGMGDGPGTPPSRGPSRGPETPPGSGGGGDSPKKEEPKQKPPQIESMELVLKFLPADVKACDAIEKSLQKLPMIKKLAVAPGEAKMTFTGNWDQLAVVQGAAAGAKLKGVLITPGIFVVDCAPLRQPVKATAAEALIKIQGVNKAFGEGTRITVFGSIALLDPRKFDSGLREYGWRFVALRSHRLRTLSYEAWEKGTRPEKLRDRLMKVPGVLRVDVDAGASTVTVLLMRETAKDFDLVTAAEDVGITIFPGTAEEEEEAPEPPPAPPAPAEPAPTDKK
jgi:hypothetical protein